MPTRSSSKSAPPPLPTHADPAESQPRPRRVWLTNGCIRTTVTLVIFAAYFAWTWPWYFHHDAPAAPELPETEAEVTHVGAEGVLRAPPLPGVPKGLQTKWAQYSPWHPVDEYRAPPTGCNITQVSYPSLVVARGEEGWGAHVRVPRRRCSWHTPSWSCEQDAGM